MTKAPFSTMISPTGKHQCTRIPIARNPRDKTDSFRLRIDLRQSRCERFGPGHASHQQRSCRLHNAHNLTTHYPAFISPLVYMTRLTEWALPQTTYLGDSLNAGPSPACCQSYSSVPGAHDNSVAPVHFVYLSTLLVQLIRLMRCS